MQSKTLSSRSRSLCLGESPAAPVTMPVTRPLAPRVAPSQVLIPRDPNHPIQRPSVAVVIMGTPNGEAAELIQHYHETAQKNECGFSAVVVNDDDSSTVDMVRQQVPIDAIKVVITTDPTHAVAQSRPITSWLESGAVQRFRSTDKESRDALFDLPQQLTCRQETCSGVENILQACSCIDRIQDMTDDESVKAAWTDTKSRLLDVAAEIGKRQVHTPPASPRGPWTPHRYLHNRGTGQWQVVPDDSLLTITPIDLVTPGAWFKHNTKF